MGRYLICEDFGIPSYGAQAINFRPQAGIQDYWVPKYRWILPFAFGILV